MFSQSVFQLVDAMLQLILLFRVVELRLQFGDLALFLADVSVQLSNINVKISRFSPLCLQFCFEFSSVLDEFVLLGS